MKTIRNLFILTSLLGIAIIGLSFSVNAKIYVEFFVASGQIVVLNENVITLDDGNRYYPESENQQLNVYAGQKVSIRYVIDEDGNRIYSKTAPGLNSLKMPSAPPTDMKKPKSKL